MRSRSKVELTGLFGKVREVMVGADYRVQVVKTDENLRVRKVQVAANGPGLWEMVNTGEHFTVEFVHVGEDFKIRYVNVGEGVV
jgi:hypothetical protein